MTKLKGARLAAVLAIALTATTAGAATIDLSDGVFGNPSVDVVTEQLNGVTYSFTSTSNLVGGVRWLLGGSGTIPNGLHVGGGGGSTLAFDLTVSANVLLTGYGTNEAGGFPLGTPTFDMTDGVTTLISNGQINPGVSVSGLNIALNTGTTYSFTLANTGAAVQGFFTSFEVQSTAPVPLPAGLPLLVGGIGALAWLRRRS